MANYLSTPFTEMSESRQASLVRGGTSEIMPVLVNMVVSEILNLVGRT